VSFSYTRKLLESGFLSSLTLPIRFNGQLYGFLFFNAAEKAYFSESRLATLKAYAGVISLLVINELQTLKTFKGAVKTAREFSRHRDEETGNHLERMSRYARLIAQDVAPLHDKTDEWVEYIFQFAPLHDVGKVAVPDDVLLKPGKLTHDEYQNFFGMLVNIVVAHHEALDGSGYPLGLKDDEIPLEARIVAVADIFDALTSCRPYKERWSNQRAIDVLKQDAGVRLDKECVEALLRHEHEIEVIQKEFAEDFIG
jgi:two-component system, response regulator RpfG